MADDELIGETIGGSGFDDQIAKFMRTEQFAALLDGALSGSTAVVSPSGALAVVPVGTIVAYGGASAPSGWLLCDGAAFDQNEYPELRRVLGGTATPDLKGRTVVGAGAGTGLTARARGDVGGSENAVVVSHDHTITTSVSTSNATWTVGNFGVQIGNYGPVFALGFGNVPAAGHAYANLSVPATGVGVSADAEPTGEPGAGKNMPPFRALNYIIKAR